MLKIGDIMSRDVLTLPPDMPAHDAAAALAQRGISGAPVVDTSGRLVGILSLTDLTDPERRPRTSACTVGHLMTPALLTLHDSDLAMNAVRLMVREQIHRVVVLDDDGQLAGIVTPADIVRALAAGARIDDDAPDPGPARPATTVH
jgi:CBS domain-containing membrane protein